MEEGTVSIVGLPRAQVLAALYNGAKPQGLGFMHYTPEPMAEEEAEKLLEKDDYFDYLNGRVMKVKIAGDTLKTRLYNRDNGAGAAERIIAALRSTGDVNPEEAELNRLENTRKAAQDLAAEIAEIREQHVERTDGIAVITLGVPEELLPALHKAMDESVQGDDWYEVDLEKDEKPDRNDPDIDPPDYSPYR